MNLLAQDTIAAISTPPGEGGIAVIRLSGSDAIEIGARIFRTASKISPIELPGYSVRYGRIVRASSGESVDDGMITVFRGPKSFTGENSVEISCHGGLASASAVLNAALEAGARAAGPGEFTLRAFLNGKLDLARAEAVADLIQARTEGARRIARTQLEGRLSERIGAIRHEIIGILAQIEATIDFSEEVGDLPYDSVRERVRAVIASLDQLVATWSSGRLLREGLNVAIVGRPNVGKSSLLNALLRSERAIVTDVPGTTRDTLEETANLQGVPVMLVDTAGLRDTEDAVERIGIQRTERALDKAEVTLLVVSAQDGWTAEDAELLQRLSNGDNDRQLILAANKCDAGSAQSLLEQAFKMFPHAERVPVSALTGEGLEALEQAILKLASGGEFAADREEALISNVRHADALRRARISMSFALESAEQELPGDFIAIDARGAADALGEITGETAPEEVIHRIFHDFCVGK